MDVDRLKRDLDLVSVIRESVALTEAKGGLVGLCPFHKDGAPSFSVSSEKQVFHCFGCGASGDVIEFVRRRDGVDFVEACRRLGAEEGSSARCQVSGVKADARRPCAAQREAVPKAPEPSREWRSAALEVIAACESALWRDTAAARQARDYLRRRGLSEATVSRWRLGLSVHTQKVAGLKVHQGIVIPWLRGGQVDHLNLRRPAEANGPKYLAVAGGHPVLFGADSLADHAVAVLCEGEFDAMLLEQEVGNLVGVCSLGSCTKGVSAAALLDLALPSQVLVVFDADEAGEKGARRILERSPRYERATVPFGKDLTEYHQGGGDLRAWVRCHLPAALSEAQATALPPAAGFTLLDSEVLGERVALVTDDSAVVPEPWAELIRYTGDEIGYLQGLESEGLRFVHEVKRFFPGAAVIGAEVTPS